MTKSEFEAIAPQLRTIVHNTTSHMLASAEDAEDAASDAMLKLWHVHDSIHDEAYALKLATVIARNISIDIIRKRQRRLTLFTDIGNEERLFAQKACASDTIELMEEEEWLARRMEQLPPREMQILKMRHTDLMTNREIAKVLGIGEASVKVMLSNARKKLFNDIKNRNKQ